MSSRRLTSSSGLFAQSLSCEVRLQHFRDELWGSSAPADTRPLKRRSRRELLDEHGRGRALAVSFGGRSRHCVPDWNRQIWRPQPGRDSERSQACCDRGPTAGQDVRGKLSQVAKPGKGGILPGVKVTPEIAGIRGIPAGEELQQPEPSSRDQLQRRAPRLHRPHQAARRQNPSA